MSDSAHVRRMAKHPPSMYHWGGKNCMHKILFQEQYNQLLHAPLTTIGGSWAAGMVKKPSTER